MDTDDSHRPYGNEEMLTFYEDLEVSVGVTIDHLIIDNEPTSRLYLDKRALPSNFTKTDPLEGSDTPLMTQMRWSRDGELASQYADILE